MPNIVVVGGGFGGMELARALHHQIPSGYQLVLISENSYTTFNPLLSEAVGASIFPEHVVAPIREVLDARECSRFIMGRVRDVDAERRTVLCHTLAGLMLVPYEQLVLAFGNRAHNDFIPGMAEHSFPLKTVGDAMEIRNQVLRRLAQIELETDIVVRRALGHFVVIGGGFSGVEVAGELVDCLAGIRRYYPRVQKDEVRVTVVHGGAHLLPELLPALGVAAEHSLRRRGVDVRLQTRASEVRAGDVCLGDGELLAARTVVCTIGTRPNTLAEHLAATLKLNLERGRIVVAGDMSVPSLPGMWALGDCALVPNALDGKPSPPTAQFAVRQARHLALNLRRHIAGKKTADFNYRARGMIATVGHMKGVAQVRGLPLSGLPAWLLWRAYYLSQMPTLRRKLRISVEWAWEMFFPADITHLQFKRSKDQ